MKNKVNHITKSILIIICAITAVIILSVGVFSATINIMEQRGWEILNAAASNLKNELTIQLETNINTLTFASEAFPVEVTTNPDSLSEALEALQSATFFHRIDILYPDNTLLLQTGEIMDAAAVSDQLSFEQLAAAGAHMSVRTTDITDRQTPVVHYYAPVLRESETYAILVGVIDCASLSDIFLGKPYDGACQICILDSTDGSFILDEWHNTLRNYNDYQWKTEEQGFSLAKASLGIHNWELWLVLDETVAFSSLIVVQRLLFCIAAIEAIFLILYIVLTIKNAKQQEKSKAEAERQLMTSNTLINCIATLSNYSEINGTVDNLLEIITQYFGADRSYLFEINYEKQTVSNTYECVARGKEKKIDTMQNVPLEKIQFWLDTLNNSGLYHITNLEEEVAKDSDAYSLFTLQNIQSIMAVPLVEHDTIIGFLGVDNPTSNCHDYFLLSSITYFLMDNLDKRRKQKILERLSFEDTLTKIYNRNKFNEVVDEYTAVRPNTLGIAYFDLNGLKVMNDKFGHKAGDSLIMNTAQNIHLVFADHSFRIGGDEFAVIVSDIDEETFRQEVEQVLQLMTLKEISVSVGVSWCGADNDITTQLHEADERMYEDKKKHYEATGHDRRKR